MPGHSILIIEDETELAAMLAQHLQPEAAYIRTVNNGKDGLACARSEPWSLIVLDVMLPGMSGLEICHTLRSEDVQAAILMISAKGSDVDQIYGLESGADDYIAKPFNILQVVARARALLRRLNRAEPEQPTLSRGLVSLDLLNHVAKIGGNRVLLTPREFALLQHFLRHPEATFSRHELLDAVWGTSHDGYEHTVNTCINRLRAKLAQACSGGDATIETVWGVGYRLMKGAE